MNPLSHLIELLGPKALHWKHIQAGGDWVIRFPADRAIVFGLIDSGSCRLTMEGVTARLLRSGDFLLLVAPRPWVLGSGALAGAVEFEALDSERNRRFIEVGDRSSAASARLLCGCFIFDTVNADFLTALMPPLIHVRSQDNAAARLRSMVDLIGDEAWSDRPEQELIVGRLLEVMLIEALRRRQACIGDEAHPGLLAGLGEPQIGVALRALHQDLSRAWRVMDLAALAGMSRSVFAERFARLVGIAPIDYHLKWRMAVAKDHLRLGRRPLAKIARDSGYQSTSAFSTAFSRIVGCPPGRFARRDKDVEDSA